MSHMPALTIPSDMTANRLLGRITTDGDTQQLTGTQATTLLDAFTSSLKGLAPASAGGTANYLRADGTWNAPAGGTTVYNVKSATYGALGDAATDDRVAVQAAITAAAVSGGVVYFPNGTYRLTQGAGYYCLSVPANVWLVGESRNGVILKQAASIADSVRLFYLTGTDITIQCMTLDGNKANNSTQEHRHGFFAETTTRLRVDRVTAQNFTGDGFYLYSDANDSLFLDCYSTANERNGITLGGAGLSGCTIIGGHFTGNDIQQVDSEPGGTVQKVNIIGVRMTPGSTDDFVLTVSGYSSGVRAKNWNIIGCQIDGPVNCVWAESISFLGCTGVSASTTLPHFRVYRSCSKITVDGCHWNSVNTGSDAAVVHVTGTGSGDAPESIAFTGGSIKAAAVVMYGVVANGFTSLSFNNVHLEGSATGLGVTYGIYVRSTTAANHIKSVSINNCVFKNFGLGGVMFDGTTGVEFIYDARVTSCTFDSTVAAAMPGAVAWDNIATPFYAVQKATSVGNRIVGNVTTMYPSYPSCPVLIGGSDGPGAIYSCSASPESAITANIGSTATRRDTGLAYLKTSGTGNTGWVCTGGVVASGTITCTTKANYVDAEYMTIGDGIDAPKLYEFDTVPNGVTAGRIVVDISGATTASQVAVILKAAIDANQPVLTVAESSGVLTVTHKIAGTLGNVTITENVAHASHTVTGLTGGVNPIR